MIRKEMIPECVESLLKAAADLDRLIGFEPEEDECCETECRKGCPDEKNPVDEQFEAACSGISINRLAIDLLDNDYADAAICLLQTAKQMDFIVKSSLSLLGLEIDEDADGIAIICSKDAE